MKDEIEEVKDNMMMAVIAKYMTLSKEVDEKGNKQKRELEELQEKAQEKVRVSAEITQLVNNCHGHPVWRSYKRFIQLAEKLDVLKQQANDVSKTTPRVQLVKFVRKPQPPEESLLGKTCYTHGSKKLFTGPSCDEEETHEEPVTDMLVGDEAPRK